MGRFLLGVVIGIVLAPVVLLAWFHFGHPPVAVGDPPLPAEKMVTSVPLQARIGREAPQKPPFQPDEDSFAAGARLYRDQCAKCHGFHGKPAGFAAHMFPSAPQLWSKHGNGGAIGVSDDPPGETYWKIANGIRLTGMPAYKELLSETEMWQISLLLANADKPLPPEVLEIVRGEQQAAAVAGTQEAQAAPASAKKQ
jgi:mono/diheme cytochrome c family protein